jgi:hypothetical protein
MRKLVSLVALLLLAVTTFAEGYYIVSKKTQDPVFGVVYTIKDVSIEDVVMLYEAYPDMFDKQTTHAPVYNIGDSVVMEMRKVDLNYHSMFLEKKEAILCIIVDKYTKPYTLLDKAVIGWVIAAILAVAGYFMLSTIKKNV